MSIEIFGLCALDDSGLRDLMCKGDLYTWCNKRQGNELIFARLGRYLCNEDWLTLFPNAEVENLGFFGSYHRPIILSLQPTRPIFSSKTSRRFTFEHKWLLEDDFADFLKQTWDGTSEYPSLSAKLSLYSGKLRGWAKKINNLRKELDRLLCSQKAKDNHNRIAAVEREIEILSEKEEIHWKQMSIINWLRCENKGL